MDLTSAPIDGSDTMVDTLLSNSSLRLERFREFSQRSGVRVSVSVITGDHS